MLQFARQASMKKTMIREGLLDKHGRPNEKTPPSWVSGYTDYSVKKEYEGDSSFAAPIITPNMAAVVKTETKEEEPEKKRKVGCVKMST